MQVQILILSLLTYMAIVCLNISLPLRLFFLGFPNDAVHEGLNKGRNQISVEESMQVLFCLQLHEFFSEFIRLNSTQDVHAFLGQVSLNTCCSWKIPVYCSNKIILVTPGYMTGKSCNQSFNSCISVSPRECCR